jgi:TetR/AcrR family tetracycline transcriptional repressor
VIKPRPKRALDLCSIVAAAVEVIDEVGLDGLSLRVVGQRLDVTPMALYHHIDSKAALLDLVLDATIGTVSLEDLPADPIDGLVEIAQRYRRAFAARPGVAPLLALRQTPKGPASRRLITTILDLLRAAGLDEAGVAAAYVMVAQLVMGTVVTESEQEESLRPLLGELGAGSVPDRDARFDFAMEVLARGLPRAGGPAR